MTMQAVSGAGLPGVASMQILDNVIPWIAGEEEKIERETQKIFGRLRADGESGIGGWFVDHPVEVSAQCNRVPVVDGHTLCVSVGLERRATDRRGARGLGGLRRRAAAPAAAVRAARARSTSSTAPTRRSPASTATSSGGMAVSVGRLRPCPLLDFRFVTLSHNTLRGAAGGALLLAELAVAKGLLRRPRARRPWRRAAR